MPKQTKDSTPPRFEDALEQLEALIGRLEGGEISLEESLQDFERGVVLVRTLRERLDQAQQRVEKIMEEEGDAVAEPMNLEEDLEDGE